MGEFHVLVDDIRSLGCDVNLRRYGEALDYIRLNQDKITHLYLDHGLGGAKTGYDLLKLIMHDIQIPHIRLVTSNPVGRKNMGALLEGSGYFTKDGINFVKA